MGVIKDLINQRFERLVVIKFTCLKNRSAYWECLCDCGNTVVVRGSDLKSGRTKSCSCLHKEIVAKRQTKHGFAPRSNRANQLYVAWKNMKRRCLDPSLPGWKNYGARGIKICDRWLNSFENFAADMGSHPGKGYSLERINNEGDYEPKNCKWGTRKEQSRNMRVNTLLTHQGETLPISVWSERLELKENTILSRLRYGWSIEDTLSKPVRPHKQYSFNK